MSTGFLLGGGPFFWHILRFSYQKPLSLLLDDQKIIQTFGTFGSTDFSPSRVDDTRFTTCQPSIPPMDWFQNVPKLVVWGDPVETYWIGQILDRFPLGIQARNSKNSWVATTQFPIYPKQPGFFLETQNLCPHLTTSVFFIGACKVQVKCESAWALGGPWLGGCNSPLKTPELTNMTGIGKSPCSIGNTSWWIFQPVILVSP